MDWRLSSSSRSNRFMLYLLFFSSGVGALVFQVLWHRRLTLLLGNTAQAAAMTVAVFFLGLVIGGRYWGLRASRFTNPLRTYGLLEIGVALGGLLVLVLQDTYGFVYAAVFGNGNLIEHAGITLLVKTTLAASMLLPPAVLMGGTFPMMGQYMVRRSDELATTGTLLYAVNTVGAALGALAAGLYLPRAIGFRASTFVAAGLLGTVGVIAMVWGRSAAEEPNPERPRPIRTTRSTPWPRTWIGVLVVMSGFGTLSLEVLWTRMFAQVLQNSVYSFSIVLSMFLLCLGLGALLAHGLVKLKVRPMVTLSAVLAVAGLAISTSPFLFHSLTNGLQYVASEANWSRYTLAVFGMAGAVTLLPVTFMGVVFPFLLKVEEKPGVHVGETVGRLVSLNAIGAIIGPLVAGFVMMGAIGLWASISVVGSMYLLASAIVFAKLPKTNGVLRVLPFIAVAVLIPVVNPSRLGVINLGPNERLLDVWEGSAGTVAVVRTQDNLKIQLDNYYTLGDTRSMAVEQMQAHLPLLLHPNPRSTFFLGLGTGITAGAALDHPVSKVVAAELVPDVVKAVRKYFMPYINDLFTDRRVTIVVEDGRNYLLSTRERYDVIVGDLFTPWHAGTGNLYTREHFAGVRSRLREGGIFVQWLPLYQLSDAEFFTIVRTMTESFPYLTLWRGDFSSTRPIVGLVGWPNDQPLDWDAFSGRASQFFGSGSEGANMAGLFYAGNLSLADTLFQSYPVNTDDRPVIEYLAPITQRAHAARGDSRLVGTTLADLYEVLLRQTPVEIDPFLSDLPVGEMSYVTAGLKFFEYNLYRESGQSVLATRTLDELKSEWPAGPWSDER